MHLRHGHGDAAGDAGQDDQCLQNIGRKTKRHGIARRDGARCGHCRHGGTGAQQKGERDDGKETRNAHDQMRLAPADRGNAPLQQRRPESASKVIAGSSQRQGNAAALFEPKRDIGDQRAEHCRRAKATQQHTIGKTEGEKAWRKINRYATKPDRGSADQHRHHDAKAIRQLAHQHATHHESHHGHGIGKRCASAQRAEFRLHGGQHHHHGPHRRAADHADQKRNRQTRPGSAAIQAAVTHHDGVASFWVSSAGFW